MGKRATVKWLLDTHVLDWATSGDPRLSGAVRSVLEVAVPGDLAISDVTLSELARHLTAGRIPTRLSPKQWLEVATEGVVVLPVTPAIALRAASIDWAHRDPCDRHIVATAVEHRLPLLTVDEKIHDLVGVRGLKVIW
jgi:PIN domain nuclease of toxin-antitoxin system